MSERGNDEISADLAPIVCCVDDDFVAPLRVLMQSLAVVHGDAAADLKLIVIHRGLSDSSRDIIQRNGSQLGISVEFRSVPAPDWPFLTL
jgi:hypothetical protein